MPRKNVPGFPGMKERRNLIEQLKKWEAIKIASSPTLRH